MTRNFFPEDVAVRYDESSAAMFDPAVLGPAVDVLAGLAGEGPVLEFGIGTGRVALPLAERGLGVHGIDLSEAMVERLRAKPGAEAVGVTVGDFSAARVPGAFTLVYLVFNTVSNLTTQDAQVACFANAAAHLAPGGRFVIEVGVPDLQGLVPGERFRVFTWEDERWGIDEYDVATQEMWSHHFWVQDGRIERWSMPFRYAFPPEFDLMARLAGMRLEHRWADWDRRPFTAESRKHVSVWRK